EDETVEQKHDHLPKGKRSQTVARAGDERCVPAEKNPGCNRGEHARNVQPFGREISEERSEQGNGDLDRRIIEMALHKAHRETDEQSESNAANCHPHESKRRMTDRESSRHQSGSRKL